ncbi:MAG: O-antigen ligase family protein [Sphingomonas sp.]
MVDGFRDHPTVGPVVVGWVFLNLVAGSIPLAASGLYLSQPLLIALIAYFCLLRLGESRALTMPFAALVCAVTIALPLISSGTDNDRFVPEQLKMLMLVVGVPVIGMYLRWSHVPLMARFVPPILCGIILVVVALGLGDYYGDERFGVPALGSPNTTAFVITISLAFACYNADLRGKVHLFDVAILAVLLGTLIATDSDGGKVSVLFLGLRYLRVPMRVLVPVALTVVAVVILMIVLLGIELPDLLGSGRLHIWRTLTYDLFHSGWIHLLLGFGPGAIDLEPGFTASIRSAHSMFIEVAYAYGLVGLVAMVYFTAMMGIRLDRAPLAAKPRRFLEGLYVAMLSGAFVDAYFVTAQLVWLGVLVLAMLTGLAALLNGGRRDRPVLRQKIARQWS